MVVWIIGLSGSGKTTLAEAVVREIRARNKEVVLLDGDVVRELFDNDLGYKMDDRLKNARRICQLGKFLESQGVHVVCAILSIFPETQKWNRDNLDSYFEIYIDAPIESLVERDSKGLYSRYLNKQTSDVVGMDIKFPVPSNPDMVIENTGTLDLFLENSKQIVSKVLG